MSHTIRPPVVEIFSGAHNFNVEHQYITVCSPISSPPAAHELHRLLSPIPGASHTRDMKKSPPNSTCLPGTRTKLLSSIMTWVKSEAIPQVATPDSSAKDGWKGDYGYYHYHPPSSKPVVWLCGPVGGGKSAIAQIVAKEAEEAGCLAASFFFFRGMGDRSGFARVAATLASQMAEAFPETIPYIMDALKKPLALRDASVETQFERLVYHPVLAALGGRKKIPVLILIDGLDECEDRPEVEEFIDHMLSVFERHPDLPLRFFISSRIEEHIRERIEVNQVHVMNLRDHHSDKDISTLVQHTFTVAADRNRVIRSYGHWPSEKEIYALIQKAGGSFIFIKTLLNFILGVGSNRDDRRTPMERFELALKMDPGLDSLYTEILQDALQIPHSTNVILTLAALRNPLSISHMARLLDIRACDIANVLVPLQSIVHVPGDDETCVTLFHTSLRDFIKNSDRSQVLFSDTCRREQREFLAQMFLQLRLKTPAGDQSTFWHFANWPIYWEEAHPLPTDLHVLMDSVDEAVGHVASPTSLRLAMVIFDAQLRTLRTGGWEIWPPDALCAWIFDAFKPSPEVHYRVASGFVSPLHMMRRRLGDPSLHRCTVMHVMRGFVSHDSKHTCSYYVAQRLSWNILRSVDTDDGDGDRGMAAFLQTPYLPSDCRAASSMSQLGSGQSFPTSRISFRWDDATGRLEDIRGIVERKFPGLLESTFEHGAEEVPGFYTIYKEDGLCVLDMIHLLHILDNAQDKPGTYHVVVHIGDGNIICFSNRFTENRLEAGYRIARFNLYTDDVFQLFSEHWTGS